MYVNIVKIQTVNYLVLVQDDSKRHGLNKTLSLHCSICETSTIMNTSKKKMS